MTLAADGALARRARSASAVVQRLAPVALGLLATVIGLVLIHYSLRLWTHNYDEDLYQAVGARTRHGLPDALWSLDVSERGLQRLESWVFALVLEPLGSPDGFRAVRIVNIACFCSTAVPVWLWGRRLGLGALGALAAGVLALLVPWATVTATFMTENVAYPAVTWALFAIWRAAERPVLGRILAAAVLCVVAMLARTVMIVLPGVLLVVVAATVLRYDARGAWARRATLDRRHVVTVAAVGLFALVGLVVFLVDRSALNRFTGSYGAQTGIVTGQIRDVARDSVARVVSGVGVLPGIVGIGWAAQALVRPARRESFALAVLTVMTAVLVVYSALRGGPDERYLMYLAPPLLLGAGVAVARRELHPAVLAGATALVLWLFAAATWNPNAAGFAYMVSAAQMFHARILLLNLGSHVPVLSDGAALAVLVAVAAAVVGVALARPRARAAGLVLGLLVAGVVVVQLAQTLYVERHFTTESAWGPPALADRAWVDRAVDGRKGVALFVPRTAGDLDLNEAWRETAFWNLTLRRMLSTPDAPQLLYVQNVAPQRVDLDPETGHLVGVADLPGMMVEPRLSPTAPLVGTTVASAGYEPMALVRVRAPARVAWLVSDGDPAGWTLPGKATHIRVYETADTRHPCLTLGIVAPPGLTGSRAVHLRSGDRSWTARVTAARPLVLRGVRLAAGTDAHFADVGLSADGATALPGGGAPVGVRLVSIQRTGCRT